MPPCRRRRPPPRALSADEPLPRPPARGETGRQCRQENPLPAHPLRHRPAGRPKQRRPLYLGDAPPRWPQPLLRDERSRRRLRGRLVPPARPAPAPPPGQTVAEPPRTPAAPGCPAGRAGARPQGALVGRTHPRPARAARFPPASAGPRASRLLRALSLNETLISLRGRNRDRLPTNSRG